MFIDNLGWFIFFAYAVTAAAFVPIITKWHYDKYGCSDERMEFFVVGIILAPFWPIWYLWWLAYRNT